MDQTLLNLITTRGCRCNKIQCIHINRLVNLICKCLEDLPDGQYFLLKEELSTTKYQSKYSYSNQLKMTMYDYVIQKYDKDIEKKKVFGDFLRECEWYPYSELSETFDFKLRWHKWDQELMDECKKGVPFTNLDTICDSLYYKRFEIVDYLLEEDNDKVKFKGSTLNTLTYLLIHIRDNGDDMYNSLLDYIKTKKNYKFQYTIPDGDLKDTTTLHAIAVSNELSLLKHYLEVYKIDPNLKTGQDETILFLAIYHDSEIMFNFLLKYEGINLKIGKQLDKAINEVDDKKKVWIKKYSDCIKVYLRKQKNKKKKKNSLKKKQKKKQNSALIIQRYMRMCLTKRNSALIIQKYMRMYLIYKKFIKVRKLRLYIRDLKYRVNYFTWYPYTQKRWNRPWFACKKCHKVLKCRNDIITHVLECKFRVSTNNIIMIIRKKDHADLLTIWEEQFPRGE